MKRLDVVYILSLGIKLIAAAGHSILVEGLR
jgi:hypothetical protein